MPPKVYFSYKVPIPPYMPPVFNVDVTGKELKVKVVGYQGYKLEVWGVGKAIKDVLTADITSDPFEINVPYDGHGLEPLDPSGAVVLVADVIYEDPNTGETQVVDRATITIFVEPGVTTPYLNTVLKNLGLDEELEGMYADILMMDLIKGAFTVIKDWFFSWEQPTDQIFIPEENTLWIIRITKDVNGNKISPPKIIIVQTDYRNSVYRLVGKYEGKWFGFRITATYKSSEAILDALLSLAGDYGLLVDGIYYNDNLTVEEKIKLLTLFAIDSIFNYLGGRVYYVGVDPTAKKLDLGVILTADDPDWDWGRVGLIILGCILIGLGIFTYGTSVSLGGELLGIALGGVGAGLVISQALEWVSSNFSKDIVVIHQNITYKFEQARQDINAKIDELDQLVEQLYQDGKISADVYNLLKAKIKETKDFVNAKLDDLEEQVHKAINEAYNKGKEEGKNEAKWWIVGAGLGGFIAGAVISK